MLVDIIARRHYWGWLVRVDKEAFTTCLHKLAQGFERRIPAPVFVSRDDWLRGACPPRQLRLRKSMAASDGFEELASVHEGYSISICLY